MQCRVILRKNDLKPLIWFGVVLPRNSVFFFPSSQRRKVAWALSTIHALLQGTIEEGRLIAMLVLGIDVHRLGQADAPLTRSKGRDVLLFLMFTLFTQGLERTHTVRTGEKSCHTETSSTIIVHSICLKHSHINIRQRKPYPSTK